MDEIAYRDDSVAEACADHGIKSYMDWDEAIFPECRICDDDDDEGGGAGPGGGSEECERCGEGKVPNHDKTACISCRHGESTQFPGRCCLLAQRNRQGRQGGTAGGLGRAEGAGRFGLLPERNRLHRILGHEHSGQRMPSRLRYASLSCWGGSKTDGCNLSRAHTHPFFSYPRDKDVTCHGDKMDSKDRATRYNLSGRNFSPKDTANARSADVLGHLGLPPHEPDEGDPIPTERDTVKALRRSGLVEEK